MTKIQVNSQGKAYMTSGGKVLLYPEGGSSGKYALLERIKDDSNNEIGTVSGFFTDANDTEYAVVCLDAQYRLGSGSAKYTSTAGIVTNLPTITNQTLYSSTETATFNTQKILDYCTANNKSSAACNHCVSKSFTIGGTTYTGALPNVIELIDIFRHRIQLNTLDTTASSYSSLIVPTSTSVWASNQYDTNSSWYIRNAGSVYVESKTVQMMIIPVLEIPNAL